MKRLRRYRPRKRTNLVMHAMPLGPEGADIASTLESCDRRIASGDRVAGLRRARELVDWYFPVGDGWIREYGMHAGCVAKLFREAIDALIAEEELTRAA